MTGHRQSFLISAFHAIVAGLVSMCLMLAAFSIAPAADAQSKDADRAESADGGDRSILAGPRVREDDGAGEAAPVFGGQARGPRVDVPAEQWFRMLRELELSQEQAERAQAIRAEFDAAVREFRATYGPRLRELEARRRAARAEGTDLAREELESMLEINQKTPRLIEVQQRIWGVLSAEQQDLFRARLEEQRRLIMERRRAALERQNRETDDAATMTMSESGMAAMEGAARDERRPRAGAGSAAGEGMVLDEAGLRRLEFLRSRQRYRPRGQAPTDADRRFRFDDAGPPGR